MTSDECTRLAGDGCLVAKTLHCDLCGNTIEPGTAVHCDDGYDRVYGEFVLDEIDDMHEHNWPKAHRACAAERRHGDGDPAHVFVPRAVVLHGSSDLVRLTRVRAFGFGALALTGAAALSVAAWGGVGASVLLFCAGAGAILVGWGLAVRPRD